MILLLRASVQHPQLSQKIQLLRHIKTRLPLFNFLKNFLKLLSSPLSLLLTSALSSQMQLKRYSISIIVASGFGCDAVLCAHGQCIHMVSECMCKRKVKVKC